MRILVSLSAKESGSEKVDRLKADLARAKKHISANKRRAEASKKKLESAQKYLKSNNPDTVAKYKKLLPDLKTSARNFERTYNKSLKDVERLEKLLAAAKKKFAGEVKSAKSAKAKEVAKLKKKIAEAEEQAANEESRIKQMRMQDRVKQLKAQLSQVKRFGV